ncbi:MSMEG_1061 family FMN-dependent PPOX-type flavoprotein [Polymorphobacter sp.]|uniref:MSMEG_1061 family FMN-dependent PPOX-type flavoprotein n=1 Tax=Polymorphobacter sp. TaxID=1909290 RepID=UPI003F6FEC67
MTDSDHRITDEQTLEAIIGEPMEFVRAKIVAELSDAMRQFIASAPLAFVATIDEHGRVDISPKGDPAGFVLVDSDGSLLVPERPGNRLAFGFRNILRGSSGGGGGEVGLIFLAPNQRETLRIKGVATLHNDPAILTTMHVGGKPALLYMRVRPTECHFHCGKALIRSHLWQPEKWTGDAHSIAARGYASQGLLGSSDVAQTETVLDQVYRDELY